MYDTPGGREQRPGDEDVARHDQVRSIRSRQMDKDASWAVHNWGWVLGLGVAAIVFGAVVLSNVFASLSTLVWLTGLFLLFIGVVQLVTLGRGGDRRVHLLAAVVAVVGG